MLNLYNGTLGYTIDQKSLTDELERYRILNEDSIFTGELPKHPTIKFLPILNNDDTTKDIKYFRHPLLYKNARNEQVIALDFRLFMKKDLTDITSIRSSLLDRYNGELLLYRGLFIYLFLTNKNIFNSIDNDLAIAFASTPSTILARMTHDTNVLESTNLACLIYYKSLDSKITSIKEVVDSLPMTELIKFKNSHNYNDVMDNLLDKESTGEIQSPVKSLDDLILLIKLISNSKRLQHLNKDLYINSLARGFYSNNNPEYVVAFNENKATWIAILYMILTESINKKSSIFKSIKGRGRAINIKSITTTIKNIIDDQLTNS